MVHIQLRTCMDPQVFYCLNTLEPIENLNGEMLEAILDVQKDFNYLVTITGWQPDPVMNSIDVTCVIHGNSKMELTLSVAKGEKVGVIDKTTQRISKISQLQHIVTHFNHMQGFETHCQTLWYAIRRRQLYAFVKPKAPGDPTTLVDLDHQTTLVDLNMDEVHFVYDLDSEKRQSIQSEGATDAFHVYSDSEMKNYMAVTNQSWWTKQVNMYEGDCPENKVFQTWIDDVVLEE